MFASLIGGNSLPVRRCGPGRGQDQERARYCPVFVCCLRMHSDGGMDHLGEAAGSRGAAALHYDREVRAPSQPSVGPSGGPWEYLLLSLTTPRPPSRPSASSFPSSVQVPVLPALRGYPKTSDAPLLQLLLTSSPILSLYSTTGGRGSSFRHQKRTCGLSPGTPTLQSQRQSPSGSLNRFYKEGRIAFGQRRASGEMDLLITDASFFNRYLLSETLSSVKT